MDTEKNLLEKECEICGVWFTPYRKTQRYCKDCGKHSGYKQRELQHNLNASIARCGTGRQPEAVTCICKRCGQHFTTYGAAKPYCSKNCKIEDAIADTVCENCGKKMTDTEDQRYMSGRPWFCSDACRNEHKWKSAKEQGRIKVCPECGKEFINKNITFCSKECYKHNIEKYGRPKPAVQTLIRQCTVCGKPFNCSVDDLRNPICSPDCKSVYQKKRKKLKMKNQKAVQNQKKQDFINKNGLCGICRTSYKDCERLQSNFTASPEHSCFSGSLIIKCPKFTAPKKLPW